MSRATAWSFAVAAAVAACSSTSPPAAPPPPQPGPAGNTPAADADDWGHVMKQVKRRYQLLEDNLTHPAVADLRAVATAANEAAELMRLGYGRFEDRSVPGFAKMAREAESWFLQLGLEARQAHGDIARELFLGERKRHCGDCHDADERVHG